MATAIMTPQAPAQIQQNSSTQDPLYLDPWPADIDQQT
jgi:hypothetical protein